MFNLCLKLDSASLLCWGFLSCSQHISTSFLKVVCLYGTKCSSRQVCEWVSESHINEHGAPPPKKTPMVVSSFQVKAQKSCEGGFGLQILYLLMYHFGKQIKPNCSHITCTEISFSSKGGISCSLLIFSVT